MTKNRVPMQVSPEFEKRIKQLQSNIMRQDGKNISLREITEKIIKVADFKRVEEIILRNPKIDIKIALDRRRI